MSELLLDNPPLFEFVERGDTEMPRDYLPEAPGVIFPAKKRWLQQDTFRGQIDRADGGYFGQAIIGNGWVGTFLWLGSVAERGASTGASNGLTRTAAPRRWCFPSVPLRCLPVTIRRRCDWLNIVIAFIQLWTYRYPRAGCLLACGSRPPSPRKVTTAFLGFRLALDRLLLTLQITRQMIPDSHSDTCACLDQHEVAGS